MAAYGWLLRFADEQPDSLDSVVAANTAANTAANPVSDTAATPAKASEVLLEKLSKQANLPSASSEELYDWLYVATLKSKNDEIYKTARKLAENGGKRELSFFLASLVTRGVQPQINDGFGSRQPMDAPKKKPLGEDDLQFMLKCYDLLATTKKDKDASQLASVSGNQVIYGPNGQMYINMGGGLVQVSGDYFDGASIGTITSELKLAGREKEAEERMEKYLSELTGSTGFLYAMNLSFKEEKYDQLPSLYEKWITEAKKELAKAASTTGSNSTGSSSNRNLPNIGRQLLASVSSFRTQWMG